MYLPGKFYQVLGSTDDSAWQCTLDQLTFLTQNAYSIDDEHVGLAFYTLMRDGELVRATKETTIDPDFYSLPVPEAALSNGDLLSLTWAWHDMHARNYGDGMLLKMGLYVIKSGGIAGFHVDGPVILKGKKVDMAEPRIQRALLEMQASHRTILPLRFNPEDRFMVCNYRVSLKRGELFEFNNAVPHAYFNSGEKDAILLVTSYLSEALLPAEFNYQD